MQNVMPRCDVLKQIYQRKCRQLAALSPASGSLRYWVLAAEVEAMRLALETCR